MIINPGVRSWLKVDAESDFPIQNLPFGEIERKDRDDLVSPATRIGDFVVDIGLLIEEGLIQSDFGEAGLDMILMDGGVEHLRQIRAQLYELLEEDCGDLRDNDELRNLVVLPLDEVIVHLPLTIPQFVDFYSGIHHASNVGKMFRPDQPPLLPNYRHLPIGYNGRASSVVPSGTDIRRPWGQVKPADADTPSFAPTQELDFELELGFFIGEGSELGQPISIENAESHMAGLVLVNDWSARDVQRWEYQPLGPFLAKSFGTSISPWIVTLDALEPFRIEGPSQEPNPLSYLCRPRPGHFDIHLEVTIQTARATRPQTVCRTSARQLYWDFAQQLAHQTVNGTNISVGDLYASGTISGPEEGSFGSLLEATWRGTKPIVIEETGETRTFLEDGDTVVLKGWCQGDGYRVGFGECRGMVLPAVER
jgi:fumarylacetoacetase